jgi:hypothetical protein
LGFPYYAYWTIGVGGLLVEGDFLRFFGKVDLVACHPIDIFSWVEKIDCHPLGGICGEGKGVVGVWCGTPKPSYKQLGLGNI